MSMKTRERQAPPSNGRRAAIVLALTAAMLLAASAAPVSPASAWAKRCRVGHTIYSRDLRLFSTVQRGRLVLGWCTYAARRPRTTRLPASVTRLVQVDGFQSIDQERSVVGVLAATRTRAGTGAFITDTNGDKATIGPATLHGHHVVQFALNPDSPLAAVLLDSGTVLVIDGSTSRVVGRAVGAVKHGSLVLDAENEVVVWRTAAGKEQTALLYPPPTCDASGQEISATPQVRVFASKRWGDRRLYACLRAGGQVQELLQGPRSPGATCTGCAGDGIDEAKITIAGPDVVYSYSVFDGSGYGAGYTDVLDIARGRITEFGLGEPYVIASDGSVAYLVDPAEYSAGTAERACVAGLAAGQTATALIAVDPAGERMLDCRADPAKPASGPAPRSITDLKVDGQTLTWSSLGTPSSAQLG